MANLALLGSLPRSTQRRAGAVLRRHEPGQRGLTPRTDSGGRRWQTVLNLVVWALLTAACARPVWVEQAIEHNQPVRDMMLAIDISQSMETRDYTAADGTRSDRLSVVRDVVRDFITRRKDDRIGLIVFGTGAYPQAPLTLDHASLQLLLDQVGIGMAGPNTALGDAIGLSIKLFAQAHEQDKVLILLTDGNDTGSAITPAHAAQLAKAQGIVIHTIGIGDPQASGEAKVDLGLLQDIARQTGGRFFRADDRDALQQVYATLDSITPARGEDLAPPAKARPGTGGRWGRRWRCWWSAMGWPPGLAADCWHGEGRMEFDFSAFHFLRPYWLLLLVPALLLPWLWTRRHDLKRQLDGVIAPHLVAALVITPEQRQILRPVHLLALLLGLGAVAAAGPTWTEDRPDFLDNRAPLILAFDLSPSMDADDVPPSRLTAAKHKMHDLLKRRAGARTALIAYAGSAHLVLPATQDPGLLDSFMQALDTSLITRSGRDVPGVIDQAKTLLAAEKVPGTLVLITDGADATQFDAISEHLKDSDLQVLVLAVGSQDRGVLHDRQGAPAGGQ
ncbi:hypothetical protein PPS11_26956 [Pseudomonas putida S11]|nr:hypothetical protein PPS11_26956 [Pseudomonas putida S11]